ncbi:MAG: ABC transporter substrate-binding protein [Desulfobacterales bacterium]|nr:ABC transporter substrate-binding protein [Desulfobacterales bacterium]
MKRTLCWVLILGLVISLGMIGCAKKEKEIKIGVVLPLSGPAAGHGEDILAGIDLAMEESNIAGGINGKQIELVI